MLGHRTVVFHVRTPDRPHTHFDTGWKPVLRRRWLRPHDRRQDLYAPRRDVYLQTLLAAVHRLFLDRVADALRGQAGSAEALFVAVEHHAVVCHVRHGDAPVAVAVVA